MSTQNNKAIHITAKSQTKEIITHSQGCLKTLSVHHTADGLPQLVEDVRGLACTEREPGVCYLTYRYMGCPAGSPWKDHFNPVAG